MKTRTFLLSALALVAMTACNKDADPKEGTTPEGAPAFLEIRLADSAPQGRTAGVPVEATETAIKKGMVFVFKGTNANPALDAKVSFDFTGSTILPIRVNITQGIRQVYVVSNVTPADFAAVNTLSDLQHITNKLSLAAFRTSGALPMSGFVNNVDASTATTTTPLTVPVQLNFIGSRVHVDWDITNLNTGLTGLTITGAAILNVNSTSEYIATPNGSGGYNALTHNMLDYLQGIGNTLPVTFIGTYLPSVGLTGTTNLYDTELFVLPADKGFDKNYIYVFENKSSKPIIVAIQGTYDSTTYYWPIVINGALNGIGGSNAGDQSASIGRGMIYKVKAVIRGLGTLDPYAPINPGAIDVIITPAAWAPAIQIDQEFL